MSAARSPSERLVDATVTIDRPRVSAVITTYNAADHIPGLSQRLAAMPVVDEIVIYDDASSDCTPALLKDCAARDSRIKLLLASHNAGVAGARNEALAHCRGEFVWFADPDDEWSPHVVEVLYQAVVDTGADIAVGRADQRAADRQQTYVIDGLDRWATRDRAATIDLVLTGAMRGYLWNKLLRRSIMPTAPFPPMRSQSDFVGLVRAVGRSRSTVFVPHVLYTRIERAGSITRTAEDQVENLRRCTAAVESILAEEGRLEQCAESFQYFMVWFFAIPAVNTPLRTGASSQLVRFGIHSALDVVKEMPIGNHFRIARIAPRLEFQVMCLLFLRGAYPAAYRAAKALRATLRATRR
jgi:glycosyltransferase involved in cell wall biosynthesis